MVKESLKSLMIKMAGKEIWDFRLGESSGSIISFECGEKIRCESIKNYAREYEGEKSIMIYCSWRISKSSKIITSWKDSLPALKKGISEIETLKIINVDISDSFDLLLKLENGFCLQVFCDEGVNSNFDCNWFFRDSDKFYSINNNGKIDVE